MTQGKAKKTNTVGIAQELILPVLETLGLSLWDVRFEKEGANWYLRYFIDKPDGVNIQDCVDVSHAVEKLLDAADPIEQSYILEVCSPGVERDLTKDAHFQQYLEHDVTVRLIRPVNGVRDFVGRLLGKEGDEVRIVLSGAQDSESLTQIVVSLKECAYIRLCADFETGGLE